MIEPTKVNLNKLMRHNLTQGGIIEGKRKSYGWLGIMFVTVGISFALIYILDIKKDPDDKK